MVLPISDLIKHENIIDYREYRQASAIITGIGLFATFLAILVALLDVRLINNRVQGLDLLIQGLSGKFLSSVAALFGAIVLIAMEKRNFRFFQNRVSEFTKSLDTLIPQITNAQILSDLHKEIGEQSTLFKHFNTDLSFKLKESFGESVGPTLERMVSAIDDLNQFLRAAEAKKQESITEQLSDLLRSFEDSILESLKRMGEQFNTSLSGSTQSQFEKASESLANTTTLLQAMNRQFAANQNIVNELIAMAKTSTTEQIQQGQAHVQDLTNVLKDLMAQLQEKTGESLGSVEKVLANVTQDLSNKITDLSVQMASVIEDTSGKSTEAAKQVIDQAGVITSKNSEQFEKMLSRHSSEISRVEDLTLLLDQTLKEFAESIPKYNHVIDNLKKLSIEANLAVKSMERISNDVRQVQEAITKASTATTAQLNSLDSMNQNQKDVWQQIKSSMQQYEITFVKVEREAKELLAHLGGFLQNYSSTTEDHFNKLGTLANNHISDATGRISGSIDELREYLDDLQEILAAFINKLKR